MATVNVCRLLLFEGPDVPTEQSKHRVISSDRDVGIAYITPFFLLYCCTFIYWVNFNIIIIILKYLI